jgi:hypothetical protein
MEYVVDVRLYVLIGILLNILELQSNYSCAEGSAL